jgi:RNA polymerase primary sigma factor
MRKVTAAKTALWQELGQEPAVEQIAMRCDMPVEKVQQLLQLVPQLISLDAPAGEEDASLAVLLENTETPDPQAELVRLEMKQILEHLLSSLTERQQQILRLHFGLEDGVCHSLEEISTVIGVSKERVRQIERQAMDRLQKLGSGVGLEDFLE